MFSAIFRTICFAIFSISFSSLVFAHDASSKDNKISQHELLQFVNVSDWTVNDARLAVAAASKEKVAIIVWGGTKSLQYEAFLAAQDLVNEGIPTAFIIAPDTNGHTADAYFEVFAKSAPKGDSTFGIKNAHLVRQDMYEGAKSAHEAVFKTH